MKKPVILLIILVLIVFDFKNTKAQEVYDLKEMIQIALKNNHYIKSKQYGVLSAEKDLSSAIGNFYPKLILEEKFTTGDQTSYSVFTKLNQETLSPASFLHPGSATNFQTVLSLEVPIYVRELHIMKESKKLSLYATSKEFERFQEEIAFNVFQTYLNVIKSKAFVNTAENSLKEAMEVYRVAKVRSESGVGLKSDELRAMVFLKDRETMLIKAKNDLEISKKTLGLILAENKSFDVKDEVFSLEMSLPSIEDAIRTAIDSRKDLIAQNYNVENAQKYYELQKSRFYPKVFLSGSYYNDGRNLPLGSDGSGYVVGVAMRWEFFDKSRYDDEAKTRYQALSAKEMLKQFEKQIKYNVEVAYLNVIDAKKRLEVAKEAVKEGEETFRLIKLRYDNNLSTMVEILDAELSLVMARNNLIKAQSEYYEALGKALFEAGLFSKIYKD